jgi:hypothetical protein
LLGFIINIPKVLRTSVCLLRDWIRDDGNVWTECRWNPACYYFLISCRHYIWPLNLVANCSTVENIPTSDITKHWATFRK